MLEFRADDELEPEGLLEVPSVLKGALLEPADEVVSCELLSTWDTAAAELPAAEDARADSAQELLWADEVADGLLAPLELDARTEVDGVAQEDVRCKLVDGGWNVVSLEETGMPQDGALASEV